MNEKNYSKPSKFCEENNVKCSKCGAPPGKFCALGSIQSLFGIDETSKENRAKHKKHKN